MNTIDLALQSHAGIAAQKVGPLCCPTGVAVLDAMLGGGVVRGRMHEVYALEPGDMAGAGGFVALLATGVIGRGRPLIWLRERQAAQAGGVIQAEGLVELCGIPSHDCLFVLAEGNKALLRASLDAVYRHYGHDVADVQTQQAYGLLRVG